jgi:multidrug efflux system membrane fusion protein
MRRAPLVNALAAALLTTLIAGCSSRAEPVEAPRPVLVAHPFGAAAMATSYAGEIRAREEATLSFRVGGNLVVRRVDVGDHVHRGDLLAVLDPGDLQAQARAARAQLAAAEAQLQRARADQRRYATLGRDQLVSRSTLDAQNAAAAAAQGEVNAARAGLLVARNQAAYTQLRAPRDGVVATRQAEAGQVVTAGQAIFTLAGDGGREVAFAVPESRVASVHAGDAVAVELWSTPGMRMPARVREVSPAADTASRTYAVRAVIDGGARADLGASARVYLGAPTGAALALPLAALQRDAHGGTAVFVVDLGTGTARLRPVQVGAFDTEGVPVLSGVGATDWIVAAGGHLLRDGQKVQPVDRDNRPVRR